MCDNLNFSLFFDVISRCRKAYNDDIKKAVLKYGISEEIVKLLLFIFNHKGIRQSEEILLYGGFNENTFYDNMKFLDENNYIIITPKVTLTGKGAILSKSLSEIERKAIEEFFKNFSNDEIELINGFFGKINTIF